VKPKRQSLDHLPIAASSSKADERSRMVRVHLTDEEWQAVKIKAVQRGEPVQDLVTELLRQAVAGWRP